MQKAYIDAVYELAQVDKRVIMLTADNGTDYDKWFQREFPNQYFDMGISEGNMIGAAAGLCSCGKIPFVQTAGAFLVYHAFEFIRNDICLQKSNVKIIGSGSGLSISNLGPTHHTTEDISALRAIPGITILSPCSSKEVFQCVHAAYEIEGPVYIRLGMSKEKDTYLFEDKFQVGKCTELCKGEDAVIFVTGSIILEAIEAAEVLRKDDGIGLKVVDVSTLKPITSRELIGQVENTSIVFTLEEHNVYGGLGSIVAECLLEEQWAGRLVKLGLKDCFACGYGSIREVRRKNGIDKESIIKEVRKVLSGRA